jgi:hypothetical protein
MLAASSFACHPHLDLYSKDISMPAANSGDSDTTNEEQESQPKQIRIEIPIKKASNAGRPRKQNDEAHNGNATTLLSKVELARVVDVSGEVEFGSKSELWRLLIMLGVEVLEQRKLARNKKPKQQDEAI